MKVLFLNMHDIDSMLFNSDSVSLPSADIFQKSTSRPLLLSVVSDCKSYGSYIFKILISFIAIPHDMVTRVVRSNRGPTVQKIKDTLFDNGISMDVKEMVLSFTLQIGNLTFKF